MEPEGSFPSSQAPATFSYPEPTPSSPHNPFPLPQDPSRPWVVLNNFFPRGGVVSASPNPEAGGPPLVGCPRLLIQLIRSYPPYRRPILHPQPYDAPCRGDRDSQTPVGKTLTGEEGSTQKKKKIVSLPRFPTQISHTMTRVRTGVFTIKKTKMNQN